MIVIGIVGGKLILVYRTITQDTCIHDAKVKMPGHSDRYECTRCHKFIVFENNLKIIEVTKKGDKQ